MSLLLVGYREGNHLPHPYFNLSLSIRLENHPFLVEGRQRVTLLSMEPAELMSKQEPANHPWVR